MNGKIISALAVLALGASVALYGCSDDGHMMDGEHHEGMEHEEGMGHGGMMEEHGEMGTEEHGEAMERQHESMLTLQREWMKAKSAMEKGEPSGATGPAMKMEEAAGMQDEFMLHKGAENREDFLAKSQEFKSLVMRFRATAETGDTKSLKEIAPQIDQACNECHQAFR